MYNALYIYIYICLIYTSSAAKAVAFRFEYVFDLSFCALAWRAAEEFEKDSDTSGDEGPPDALNGCGVKNSTTLDKENAANRAETETGGEGKRRVQVTGG